MPTMKRSYTQDHITSMDARVLGQDGPLPVFRLGGRVAMITGGAGAIGRETARRLLREGANVSLVDIDSDALDAAVVELRSTLSTGQSVHSRILTVIADVTLESEVEKAVQRTVQTFGRLDTAFLNAGTSFGVDPGSVMDTTEELYEKYMRLNVKSAFLGLKHAANTMQTLANGGSIILTSSIAGLRSMSGHILESTSKSALNGLATTAAGELGQYKIRVNTIHPSGLGKTIARTVEGNEELEEMRKGIPLGRFAQPDDVASVVAFLASEDSKFMTGGDLKVEGGWMSH